MKKAWMISTACAAVLALGGAASAQGMNEHGGKNTPAAEQKGAAPAHAQTEMNAPARNEPSRAGSAQNMDKNAAPKANAQRNENAGGEKAGTAQNMEKNAAPKGSAQRNEQMGNEKSGSEKSGSKSAAERNSMQPNTKSTAEGKDNARTNERIGEQKSGTTARERTTAGAKERSTSGSAPAAEVKLTTEQRTKIRKVVVDEKRIPRLTKVNFDIKVGVRVPRTVHFYSVPEEIVTIHPAWRSYRVIYVNEDLVLIDPTSFEIMYVFPV